MLLLTIGAGYDSWRALRPHARSSSAQAPGAWAAGAAGDSSSGRDAADADAMGPREAGASAAVPARPDSVLDLNAAGTAELDGLPGIGPVLARRIIEHRRLHGPFRRVEELRAVRGVGPRLLARLRTRVRVGGPRPPGP